MPSSANWNSSHPTHSEKLARLREMIHWLRITAEWGHHMLPSMTKEQMHEAKERAHKLEKEYMKLQEEKPGVTPRDPVTGRYLRRK